MTTKPNILVFIDWFWPGYLAGGPVQSIVSLVNYLGQDVNFKIITTNYDLNSNEPYAGITPNTWIRSELGCDVFYADLRTLNYTTIKTIIGSTTFDQAYINSFFSKNFSVFPLQILNRYYKNTPVIMAPRGMLGDGALAIKKYKKRLFILYSKLTGFHSNVTWHATSLQEEEEIRNFFHPVKDIARISNLPKKLTTHTEKVKKQNAINLCFISRISEKKNLDFALAILKDIQHVEIRYNIYGPIEDKNYWNTCEQIIKTLPSNITVNYKGSISPKEIELVLSGEHMMFLPTLNENFGHAIVESLLCGCPAIISDQTPWKDLEEYNAGFSISLRDKQKFTDSIIKCAKLNQEEFSAMQTHAVAYINNKINLESIKNQYKNLFNGYIKKD